MKDQKIMSSGRVDTNERVSYVARVIDRNTQKIIGGNLNVPVDVLKVAYEAGCDLEWNSESDYDLVDCPRNVLEERPEKNFVC